MGKQILGVVVGFVAWSVLWVGGNGALAAALPGLFDAQGIPKTQTVYVLMLLLSGIYSVLSGFLSARIGRAQRAAAICGVVLLAVGVAVQAAYWEVLPLWYNLIFLVLILPLNLLGGRIPSGGSRGS